MTAGTETQVGDLATILRLDFPGGHRLQQIVGYAIGIGDITLCKVFHTHSEIAMTIDNTAVNRGPDRRDSQHTVYKYYNWCCQVSLSAPALDILRTDGFGLPPVCLYAMLQLSIIFSSLNLQRCLKMTCAGVKKEDMTSCASSVLRVKVVIIEATGGGCTVDVDSERD